MNFHEPKTPYYIAGLCALALLIMAIRWTNFVEKHEDDVRDAYNAGFAKAVKYAVLKKMYQTPLTLNGGTVKDCLFIKILMPDDAPAILVTSSGSKETNVTECNFESGVVIKNNYIYSDDGSFPINILPLK